MFQLSKIAKFTRVMNGVAAGTTSQNGTGVDMKEFESVTFVLGVGALTETQVTSLKAQQSDDDGSSDAYSDLAGTLTGPFTDSDGNKVLVLEIFRPLKRYVRPVVSRGTANAVIDFVLAIQHGAKKEPITNGSTVVATETHISPSEGSA